MSHIKNFIILKKKILSLNPDVNILVVSKNQTMDKLKPLINMKQIHFGENKVQEAKLKWNNTKANFVFFVRLKHMMFHCHFWLK